MAIWTYLMEHDRGITNFHFEIAADLLNEEELELIGTNAPGTDSAGNRDSVYQSEDTITRNSQDNAVFDG